MSKQVTNQKLKEEVSSLAPTTLKPGRTNGKNSSYRSGHSMPRPIAHGIEMVLREHRDVAAKKNKKVGTSTQEKREMVIKGFFSDLFSLKNPRHEIESIYNLKQKHLIAVFNHLETQGQAPSTIQNKISVMRVFCEWIGKNGMVRDSRLYVKQESSVRRSMVVTEDKSWEGNSIDVISKIDEIAAADRNVALWLELIWALGLRVKESILIRPKVAHEGDFVWIREGTKGGRPRVVPIKNEVQRDVLLRAQAQADGKSGLLGVRGRTYEQKRRRFYHVLKRAGITLAEEGVTAHGLRHQYMQERFKAILGIDAPVKGGNIADVAKEDFHVASQKLMEEAGHSRVTIGTAYYGSRRRRSSSSATLKDKPQEVQTGLE
jgi:integrase